MKKGGKEFDRDYKFDSDYIWPEGEILFYSLYLPASKILCSAQALVIQSEKKKCIQDKNESPGPSKWKRCKTIL